MSAMIGVCSSGDPTKIYYMPIYCEDLVPKRELLLEQDYRNPYIENFMLMYEKRKKREQYEKELAAKMRNEMRATKKNQLRCKRNEMRAFRKNEPHITRKK